MLLAEQGHVEYSVVEQERPRFVAAVELSLASSDQLEVFPLPAKSEVNPFLAFGGEPLEPAH